MEKEENKISLKKLCEKFNLDFSEARELMLEADLCVKVGEVYNLRPLGAVVGGEYVYSNKIPRYIVWPQDLDPREIMFPISLGEEYIADFLEENNIEYEFQPLLKFANGEERVPDFYLPKYDLYIEYQGRDKIKEDNIRYSEKEKLYHANKVPCIFIYSDNLGYLKYIFKKRGVEQLKKFKSTSLNKFARKCIFIDYEIVIGGAVAFFFLFFLLIMSILIPDFIIDYTLVLIILFPFIIAGIYYRMIRDKKELLK